MKHHQQKTDFEDFPARFITFEGGEGAGKSTQISLLKKRLESEGFEVVATREPGGTTKAEKIRDFLLKGGAKDKGPMAEAILFAAARMDHIQNVIRPALERGAYVLCDRFSDSTRVYQRFENLSDQLAFNALERVTLNGLSPDLTLILDVPVKTGLGRAGKRRKGKGESIDRFESEKTSFHQGVRDRYQTIAQEQPWRCAVIDASKKPDDVENLIWEEVERRLMFAPYGIPAAQMAIHVG